MYRAEGMADSVTQEQSSVEGRAELKAKAEELCFFLHHFMFSLIFFCMKVRFSFGTQ